MKKSKVRLALARRHVRFVKPFEDRFARDYRALMGEMRSSLSLRPGRAPAGLEKWQARAVEAMRPAYRAAILAGGRDFLTRTLSIKAKVAKAFETKAARGRASDAVISLEAQFGARLEETIATTFEGLESVLNEAAADKLDIDEVEELIDEEWADVLGYRTDGIALTETNGAVNSVRDYLALELAELQEWVTAGDERVRPTHMIYGTAGAKPVGFDWAQLIPDAGYSLRYPCDPECHEPGEIVNCRCFTVPAGEVELPADELKDYLEDFEMDPEDVMLSEEQVPVYVLNSYTGKGIAKEWEEEEHPRAADGEFVEAGGGGGADPSMTDVGRALAATPPGFNRDPSTFEPLVFGVTQVGEKREAAIAKAEKQYEGGITMKGGQEAGDIAIPPASREVIEGRLEKLFEDAEAQPEIMAHKDWYAKEAGKVVTDLHAEFKDRIPGLGLDQVAGMLAAASANNIWDDDYGTPDEKAASNQKVVEKILGLWAADGPVKITASDLALASEFIGTTEEGAYKGMKLPPPGDYTFQELAKSDPRLGYLFNTSWAGAEMDPKTGKPRKVEQEEGGGPMGFGGMPGHVIPSLGLLRGDAYEKVYGKEGKVRSFVKNIASAMTGQKDDNVTLDVWMARAMLDHPGIAGAHFGSFAPTAPRYEYLRSIVADLAKKHGLEPKQYQAVVWYALRNGRNKWDERPDVVKWRADAENEKAAKKASAQAAKVRAREAARRARGKSKAFEIEAGSDAEFDLAWFARFLAHERGDDVDGDLVFGPWDEDDEAAAEAWRERVSNASVRKGVLTYTRKEFDPNQARDAQGRWVDIFGNEQPDEHPMEAQTEDPAEPMYAVEEGDASQPQAEPGRLSDEAYEKKNEKYNERADEIAKADRARLTAEQEKSKATVELLKPQLAAATAVEKELRDTRDKLEPSMEAAAKVGYEVRLKQLAESEAQRDELTSKIEALRTAQDFGPKQQAEIDSLQNQLAPITNRITASLRPDSASTFVSRAVRGMEDTPNQMRTPADMRAAAVALEARANELAPGEYLTVDSGDKSKITFERERVGEALDVTHQSFQAVGTKEMLLAEAAYLRASADVRDVSLTTEGAAKALADAETAVRAGTFDISTVEARAEMKAAAEQGVDFCYEKCMRDDKFYKRIHEETADEWQHIGGKGPMTLRFAAQQAFGLEEGGAFDSKQGRFIAGMDDLAKTYPGAEVDAVVQAGALRREYVETQKEITEGFTFTLAGESEIDDDAYSEQMSDDWNNLSDSDKVDIIQNSSKLEAKAMEWATDNMDEVEKAAREDDGKNEPEAWEHTNLAQAREIFGDAQKGALLDIAVADAFTYAPAKEGEDDSEERDLETMGSALRNAVGNAKQAANAIAFASIDTQKTDGDADDKARREDRLKFEVERLIHDGERMARGKYEDAEEREASAEMASVRALQAAYTARDHEALSSSSKELADTVRSWTQEAYDDFLSAAQRIDGNDLNGLEDQTSYDNFIEARDEWLGPYMLQAYAHEDPDSEIQSKWQENYEPDSLPERRDEEEIEIGPEDWPHKLIRTVSADVKNYTPNFAESWAYDRQSGFGHSTLEEEIDHSRILVFQGAKNWTTPAGQQSMGSTENEFIVLSDVPKFVKEARERAAKIEAGQIKARQTAERKAKFDTLMQQYEQLQRLRDFGTRDQHSDKLQEVEALARGMGVDWDTLVAMARRGA